MYKYLEACYRFMDIVYEDGLAPGTPEYEAAVVEVAKEFDKVRHCRPSLLTKKRSGGWEHGERGGGLPVESYGCNSIYAY